MKRGQTIVAEREYVESDSERMQARKKLKRRHVTSVVVVLLLMGILALFAYTWMKNVAEGVVSTKVVPTNAVEIKAEIVDETGKMQLSTRVKQYIAQLEGDLRDLGYTVGKVTLPVGTSRELYIDIDGVPYYFKVSMDRGTAVSAEDMVRMVKYLKEKEIAPEYVDVRVDGKGYYK